VAEDGSTARRVRVERNIYRRPSGVYEVGLKDGGGKQRWSTVSGGNTAARALRDELLARRGRGERVVTDGRLRVAEAAAKWLDGPVQNLRLRTQECYRNAIDQHLLPAFGTRRLDAISPDDLALLVRELRSRGFPESTIVIVLGIAKPHVPILGSPTRLDGSESRVPDASVRAAEAVARQAPADLREPRARANDPGGGRAAPDAVHLDDRDDAELEFSHQVDRHGNRQATKTDGSARTVPIPRELALTLAQHNRSDRASRSRATLCSAHSPGARSGSGT